MIYLNYYITEFPYWDKLGHSFDPVGLPDFINRRDQRTIGVTDTYTLQGESVLLILLIYKLIKRMRNGNYWIVLKTTYGI